MKTSHFWLAWTRSQARYPKPMADFLMHRFCVLGNGLGWHQGRLDKKTGDERAMDPCTASRQVGPLNRPMIPVFDAQKAFAHSPDGIYPMSLDGTPNTAARAPWAIEAHWLAAALVFFQGLARHPQILSHRGPPEHDRQVICVGIMLAILDTIATQGQRWSELDPVFQDMTPVWKLMNAEPPSPLFLIQRA